MNTPVFLRRLFWSTFFTIIISARALAADGDPAPAPAASETNTQETVSNHEVLRGYLQLQEQLHTTQLLLERSRQQAEAAAVSNAQATAARLGAIEQSLSAQRARDFEVIQNSNRLMLIAAAAFAVVGFLAMMFTAWLQWRATGRFTEMVAHLPPRALGGWNPQALPPGEQALALESAETNNRLFDAMSRLEKRILELEHTTAAPLENQNQNLAAPEHTGNGSSEPAPTDQAARITLLLGKGQSLLNLDKSEEAMACFDEVLAIDQNNTDALVKKGVALERQRKLDEAVECYDRAIAADSSMAIAYLYKGGICNRLERFSEALECYEHALRAQEKRHPA